MKIKISARRAIYGADAFYNYIIPRRLTLKCNPPIYKWLWFIIYVDVNNKRKR